MPQDPTKVRLRGNDPEARTGSVRGVPEAAEAPTLVTDAEGHVILSETDIQRIAGNVVEQLLSRLSGKWQ